VKRAVVILTALTAALALAACGSSSSSSSSTSAGTAPAGGGGGGGGGGSQTVKVAADPSGQLHYTTTTLSAKAGKATFDFTNESPLSHDLTIEDKGGAKLGATPVFTGGSKSFTITLQPGTYKFLCTVPGHAQAGMQGTLTVK
jgi:uncharacterized cupredoxin-like copper-binding protein